MKKKHIETSIERTLARTPQMNERTTKFLRIEDMLGKRLPMWRSFTHRETGVQWAHMPPVAA